MNRDNHYEAAFETYLRSQGAAVVAVDETRRSYLDADAVKSPDFLVVGPWAVRLVVDVKGRRFPGGTAEQPRFVWQNWSTAADVDGLARWSARLGPDYRGVLAFVYHVRPPARLPAGTPDCFVFRGRVYLVRGVAVTDYRAAMRTRSPRWGTVYLTTADFRRLVRPFSAFLRPAGAARPLVPS